MPEDRLVLVQGEQEVEEWPLPESRDVVVGRYDRTRGAPDVDLAPDRTVSRRHARLWCDEGRWWIEDLGSLPGTHVGEVLLGAGEAAPLEPGVDIRLGDTRLTLFAPHWRRFRHRGLIVEIGLASAVGYLTLRSGGPVISRLAVRNRGADAAAVVLELGLGRFARCVMKVRGLAAGEDRVLSPRAFALDAGALEAMVERDWAPLALAVDGEPVDTAGAGCSVLAYNEWPRAAEQRSALAAFVLPNHPAVMQLAAEASVGLPPGTAPETLLARLYEWLASRWRIAYRHEPPHYAADGQKVRLPHDVLDRPQARAGQGTCLDLAVLVAAALESLGAQPLLALVDGGAAQHALVGCWRASRPRIEPLIADPPRLLAHAAWVDPNGLTDDPGQRAPFELACERARRRLDESNLLFALDVAAARSDGIGPLPFAGEPRWSDAASAALAEAEETASAVRTQIATVPLLVGLLRSREALVRRVFAAVLDDTDAAAERLGAALAERQTLLSSARAAGLVAPSQRYVEVLAAARARAKAAGSPLAHPVHLLAALLDVRSEAFEDALGFLGIEHAALRARLGEIGPEALGVQSDPSSFAAAPRRGVTGS